MFLHCGDLAAEARKHEQIPSGPAPDIQDLFAFEAGRQHPQTQRFSGDFHVTRSHGANAGDSVTKIMVMSPDEKIPEGYRRFGMPEFIRASLVRELPLQSGRNPARIFLGCRLPLRQRFNNDLIRRFARHYRLRHGKSSGLVGIPNAINLSHYFSFLSHIPHFNAE
jgi:hypothetical protein